jgi:hypothetical protein
VSVADREVDRRGVPVLGPAQAGVAAEQAAQGLHVAGCGCRERVPDRARAGGVELGRLEHGATRVAGARGDVLTLGLALELIEGRAIGQESSGHTDLLPKLA